VTWRHCENFSEFFIRVVRIFLSPTCQPAAVQSRERLEQEGLMAKQTKVVIQTDSLLILRGWSSTRTWCPLCAAEAEMIALETIGIISNLDKSALDVWMNSEELHRIQTVGGSTLICLASVLARVQNPKPR
jgi:hypothetical protein